MNYWDKRIQIGLAYCCSSRADECLNRVLPKDMSLYIEELLRGTDQTGTIIELQPEKRFVTHLGKDVFERRPDNKWLYLANPDPYLPDYLEYKKSHDRLFLPDNTIYVHQPGKDMNVLHSLAYKKRQSIETAKAAMYFAEQGGAKKFIIHPVQADDWLTDRTWQKNQAFEVFKEFVQEHRNNKYSFTLCIENLEFPKYPSTVQELLDCYCWYKEVYPNIQIVVDIPHLWRSRYLIRQNESKCRNEVPDYDKQHLAFKDYLTYSFTTIPPEIIAYYHLAGCHEFNTHGIPGLPDDKNPFKDWIELNEVDEYYEENDLINIRGVIDHFLEYVIRRGLDLKIILEIQNRTAPEMLRGLQVFRSHIIDRAMKEINNR